jgi:hemerythrin
MWTGFAPPIISVAKIRILTERERDKVESDNAIDVLVDVINDHHAKEEFVIEAIRSLAEYVPHEKAVRALKTVIAGQRTKGGISTDKNSQKVLAAIKALARKS